MTFVRLTRCFRNRYCGRDAVTLVELIAVLAIIVAIAAALTPVVGNFNRSAALTSGASLVTQLIDEARQSARVRNTMAAVVVLTGHGTEEDYRVLTVLRFEPGTGWLQAREWEKLPEGVIIDFSAPESSFLSNVTSQMPLNAEHQQHLPVRFRGRSVTYPEGCSARVFMPSGALQNPQAPAQLRLVNGFRDHAEIRYTRPTADGKPADYVDLAIIGTTGNTKVSRP